VVIGKQDRDLSGARVKGVDPAERERAFFATVIAGKLNRLVFEDVSAEGREGEIKDTIGSIFLGAGDKPDCTSSKGFGQNRHETKRWFCLSYTLTQFLTQVSNYNCACVASSSFSA
jgi:hypothetical protein